jgi:hypothetical protein
MIVRLIDRYSHIIVYHWESKNSTVIKTSGGIRWAVENIFEESLFVLLDHERSKSANRIWNVRRYVLTCGVKCGKAYEKKKNVHFSGCNNNKNKNKTNNVNNRNYYYHYSY